MKKQSPFVNAAVRVCKLWKTACKVTAETFPTCFSSFLVEIVAVHTARQELNDHPSNASIFRVFQAFLQVLSKPEQLQIIMSDLYTKKDIPKTLLKQRPLVMDPSNPFNNVASRIRDWTTIRVLALSTLDTMQKAARNDW